MAKATNVTALTPKNEQLPAEMLEQFEFNAGEGVSTAAEDNLVPFIGILQALSPQISKRDPKYIPGAEEGDILVTSLNRFWKGETGIVFQACSFQRDFVEWKPRDAGGGFIGRHPQMPTTAKQVPDPKNPQRTRWIMPAGTDIVDTRYHFGYILNGADAQGEGPEMGPMQAVIALASTGHTFSRSWMTQMGQLRLPSGKGAPSRSRKYRLSTIPTSNPIGKWFKFSLKDEGWLTDIEQYAAGTALFQAIRDGSLKAAAPEASESHDGDSDSVPF